MSKVRREQTVAAKPAPEQTRPAPRRWQKFFLIAATLCLAAWLIVLIVMAWK
jgi:hypothetical protein